MATTVIDGGDIGREARHETEGTSDAIGRGRATGGGIETAMARGDAIVQGVVSTSDTPTGMSGEESGARMMNDRDPGTGTGGTGAGRPTTSMRGETE